MGNETKTLLNTADTINNTNYVTQATLQENDKTLVKKIAKTLVDSGKYKYITESQLAAALATALPVLTNLINAGVSFGMVNAIMAVAEVDPAIRLNTITSAGLGISLFTGGFYFINTIAPEKIPHSINKILNTGINGFSEIMGINAMLFELSNP